MRDLIFGRGLVFSGGSQCYGWQTSTSDFDWFVIFATEHDRKILADLCGTTHADIEFMSWDRAASLSAAIQDFEETASGERPSFDFFELRFLIRCCLGQLEYAYGLEPDTLTRWKVDIQRVAIGIYVSEWLGIYEDFYGLCTDDRFDEARLLTGQLIQYGLRLAAAQSGMIDPAPKWAYRQYVERVGQQSPVLDFLEISEPSKLENYWPDLLRKLTESIVSQQASIECPKPNLGHLPAKFCYLGLPGHKLFFDVCDRSIALTNEAYFTSDVRIADSDDVS